jgi:hypothetical protein
MSGGHFNYAYDKPAQFADDLENKLDAMDTLDKAYEFSAPVVARLRELVRSARYVAAVMKEAEWMYSGDTCEETFLERVEKIDAQFKSGAAP